MLRTKSLGGRAHLFVAEVDNRIGPPCVDSFFEVVGDFVQELVLISDDTVPVRVDEPAVVNRLQALIVVLGFGGGTFVLCYVNIGPSHKSGDLQLDLVTNHLESVCRDIRGDVCLHFVRLTIPVRRLRSF